MRDGEAARLALQHHEYNACVLDLGLPKKDGLAVLKDLLGAATPPGARAHRARDTHADKIAGLDAGADDYLTKPFDLGELRARLPGRCPAPPQGAASPTSNTARSGSNQPQNA